MQNLKPKEDEENSQLSYYRAKREKEKYYENLKKQVEKQMEMENKIEILQKAIEEKNKMKLF